MLDIRGLHAVDLWLVLEEYLVFLEGSGEGMHMAWWLLTALLVDHSTWRYVQNLAFFSKISIAHGGAGWGNLKQ